MALLLSSLGLTSPELETRYTSRDVMLYALGIGAKAQELNYLYEGKGPRVFPTFAVIPAFVAGHYLFERLGGNLLGLVHSGQMVRVHKPFAAQGIVRTVGRVTEMGDLKRLALVRMCTETKNEQGELLAETELSLIFRLDGGFGGEPPKKRDEPKVPKRDPDWTWQEHISEEQAYLYRLSGDLNPLHADPEIAQKAGFDKPILHGLCTYGMVGRAIIHTLYAGDGDKLRMLTGQFRNPVFPGETLIVQGWHEQGKHLVQALVAERAGTVVFSGSHADLLIS